MPLRAKFLFATELGDPISAIYLCNVGCMAGTAMGRVWLYSFDTKQAEELTAFSDEGIRALYLDEENSCATVGGEGCRGWKRAPPHNTISTVNFRSLDKKNTQMVKHVLQHGPWACVIFSTSSTMVHVTKQEHHLCQFKLFEYGSSQELATCDFDGQTIVVIDRSLVGAIFRFINLEQDKASSQVDIDDLPHGNNVTHAKLWGSDHLAYVAGGSSVYVYDYKRKKPVNTLTGHRAEIIAIDASDCIATLSCDAEIIIWNPTSGAALQTFHVPEASFFLGFPYYLSLHGQRILVSADEGVILIEFDEVLQ
jgi:WD40 repeat protein